MKARAAGKKPGRPTLTENLPQKTPTGGEALTTPTPQTPTGQGGDSRSGAVDNPAPVPPLAKISGLGRSDLIRLIYELSRENVEAFEARKALQTECTRLLEENRLLRHEAKEDALRGDTFFSENGDL